MEKTFIGLYSDHETDVFDRVQSILREYPIDGVTLELSMYPYNFGEAHPDIDPRGKHV
ncbi:MAG: hypothetical protein IH934_00280 [Nanoarchaeota archaeon]|nr:hypothetical protein [Nanoarchaeota archaeon]